MTKIALKTFAAALLMGLLFFLAGISGFLFTLWPVSLEDQQLRVDQATIEHLQQLKAERKFLPYAKTLYPGAPSEAVRFSAQTNIDIVIDRLLVNLPKNPRPSTVLGTIKQSLPAFGEFDSEEQDRALLYFDQILDITGAQRSDELLNVWRYGFPYGSLSGIR